MAQLERALRDSGYLTRAADGTLLVSAAGVREPVAVRYAWRNSPDARLFNAAGLPAAPFRSRSRQARQRRPGKARPPSPLV